MPQHELDAPLMDIFHVEYRRDPEVGWWTATVLEIPSVVTQGKTLVEAYRSVQGAIRLVMGRDLQFRLAGGESVWDHFHTIDPRRIAAEKRTADEAIAELESGARVFQRREV